jgi:hypothetical protein
MRLKSAPRTVLLAAIAIGLLNAAATGWAQLITLDAKDMPVQDVIAELQKQTGLEFGVYTHPRADEPVPKLTASFHDMPLKRALEVISQQTGFVFSRIGPTQFHVFQRPPQPDTAPTVEVDGYRIAVRSLAFTLGSQEFGPSPTALTLPATAAPSMTVDLDVDAPTDLAGARVAGLADDLQVKDATGRVLEPTKVDALGHVNVFYFSFRDPALLRCKWDVAFPSLEARTIEISGGLVLWRQCDEVMLELPWGEPGEKAEANGVSVTGVTYEADEQGNCRATVSASIPQPNLPLGQALPRISLPGIFGWAVWPSGRLTAVYMAPGGLDVGLGYPFTLSLKRPEGEEGAPEKLRVRAYANKGDPTLRLPFTITGIPLPDFPEWARGLTRPPAQGKQGDTGEHPFWAQGDRAGRLEVQVRVGERSVQGPLVLPVSAAVRNQDGSCGEWQNWEAVVDAQGHVLIDNLEPGAYVFRLRAYSLGHIPAPDLKERLSREFGIDAATYTWMNTVAYVDVRRGETTRAEPVVFVPRVETLSPREGEAMPKAALTFRWEPFPGAATYRVSLGVCEDEDTGAAFWVSDATAGTEVRYEPQAGHIRQESQRRLLDLRPGVRYYWYVSALDAEGRMLSQTPGGMFAVE